MVLFNSFFSRSKADRPVFLYEIRDAFAEHANAVLKIQAHCADNAIREWELPFQIPEKPDLHTESFLRRYLQANLSNLLAAFGPCEVSLCPGTFSPFLNVLLAELDEAFGVCLAREERRGMGRILNIAERIAEAKGRPGHFRFLYGKTLSAEQSSVSDSAPVLNAQQLEQTASHTRLLGIDVGGTDVKLAASENGRLICCKEYDWNPAAFETAEDFVSPLLLLVRLMRCASACPQDLLPLREKALDAHADEDIMQRFCEAVESKADPFGFEAVGLSFPDVVISDRIVGGETSKTQGIRTHNPAGYEKEFARLRTWNERIADAAGTDCRVGVINDGSMAAFSRFVENGCLAPGGVLAHTLGTDIGTGYVEESGCIPDLPLEIYRFAVDLGSERSLCFPEEDVRAIRSGGLAGTLHCTVNQAGAFRLAALRLPKESPALWREILSRRFVNDCGGMWKVPSDQRKPFLEFLMRKAEEKEPACEEIFREIGKYLGAARRETKFWLADSCKDISLYGRLAKPGKAFSLMREEAEKISPKTHFFAADSSSAHTPLMCALCETPYLPTQFAQAVGALYYGASILLKERML